MDRLPDVSVAIKDPDIRRFLIELVKALTNISENTLYSVDVTWSEPFNLQIPWRSGGARKTAPGAVRVADAYLKSNDQAPVSYGATKWAWNGDGSIKILHVEGLQLGVAYKLVFEVVS